MSDSNQSIPENKDKFEWQSDALKQWYTINNGIIEAAPGSGKTHVAIKLINQNKNNIILIVVPTNLLKQQWMHRIKEYTQNIHFGDVTDITYCNQGTVIIEVVNTLIQKESLELLTKNPPNVIIYDEVHRYTGRSFSKVLKIKTNEGLKSDCNGKLGLTATMPNRLLRRDDYNLLCYLVGEVFYQYSLNQAKRDNIISPFSISIIRVGLTTDELEKLEIINKKITILREKARQKIEKTGNRFDITVTHRPILPKMYQFEEMNQLRLCFLQRRHLSFKSRHKIYNTVLTTEKLLTLLPKEQVLIYTMTIDVAEHLVEEFNKKDLTAYPIHSKQSFDENQRILEGIKKKYGNILIAVRSLDEGIDLPQLRFIIILANSKQIRQLLQRVGRSIRFDKNNPDKKSHIIIFEISEDQFDKSLLFQGAAESYFYETEKISEFYEKLNHL